MPVALIDPNRAEPFDAAKLNMKKQSVLIDSSMDDGGWKASPPWSPVHKVALFAIIETNPRLEAMGVYYEPTLNEEQQKKQYEVGMFQTDFKKWRLILNWSDTLKDNIPPRHIAVLYANEPVGCLSPHKTVRICWKCGLDGYQNDPPCVVPGKPCPACGCLDWWGKHTALVSPHTGRRMNITPDHLVEDAAEIVQEALGISGDLYWKRFGGRRAQRRNMGTIKAV